MTAEEDFTEVTRLTSYAGIPESEGALFDDEDEVDFSLGAQLEETDEPDAQDLVPADETSSAPMSKKRLALLCAAAFGTQFMFFLFSVEILPSQIKGFVGDEAKGRTLGVVAAVGSVVSLLVSPLIGMFSDRCTSRFGRRRPFIAGGTLAIIISVIGMALVGGLAAKEEKQTSNEHLCNQTEKPHCSGNSSSFTNSSSSQDPHELKYLVAYSLFFIVGMACYAVISVAYNGLIADVVPKSQRGFASGVMGSEIVVGLLAAAGIGLFYEQLTVYGVFAALYIVLALSVLITVVSITETPHSGRRHKKINWKTVLVGYWSPLKERNFRWVFLTRFLMQMGLSTVVGYLQYWFQDVVPIPGSRTPESAVAMAMLPMLICAAITAVIGGYLSDRFHKRKPFVLTASLVMSSCCALLAALPSFYLAITTASIFGLAYGCYISVDFALVVDVLPDKKDTAKDMAVWHQALLLPQLIATPIAGFLLDHVQAASLPGSSHALGCSIGLGYIVVFAVSGIYLLLSGVFVLRIKTVKLEHGQSFELHEKT